MPSPAAHLKRRFQQRPLWQRVLLVLLALGFLYVGVEYILLPNPAKLATETPAQSALMRVRVEQAKDSKTKFNLRHQYVPLSRISRYMQRAVVLSEDARFWSHEGIDWKETAKATQESIEARKLTRGASTITQQLAKNLYLSEDRSLVRKLKEWILAKRLEQSLEKKRILELYLNFVELGNGIFGVEAASRAYFGKSAAALDAGEAAVLTAMLPAPRKRNVKRPSKRFITRARAVAGLLMDMGVTDASARQRVDAIFGIDTSGNDDDDDDE
jgi:monofunctional biosynthetic peptidoglycan transglycosylase